MQHRPHFRRRKIDRGTAVIGDDKSMAITVPFHPALKLAKEWRWG
jgi:hypothetical protein